MSIRAILAFQSTDAFSEQYCACVAGLAKCFDAHLIGLGAEGAATLLVGVGGRAVSAEWYQLQRDDIAARLKTRREAFLAATAGVGDVEWLDFVETPNLALLYSAHLADLIVVPPSGIQPGLDVQRAVDVGDLAISAGRPVLLPARGAAELKAERIVVGWKDSKEARRAVSDAMPFLMQASDVLVVTAREVDSEAEREKLTGVTTWMQRHGVIARQQFATADVDASSALSAAAKEMGADLLVMGAYAHSRMREWLFGGVTRDLLATNDIARFMSN